MKWNDFITKIQDFKKAGAKTGLNAPTIIRLVYSGAFDSMLSEEHFKIPAADRYPLLVKEALTAMKSKASIPKKTPKDIIGIADISGMGHLMLWRYTVNPYIKYDITNFTTSFLKTHGFEKPKIQEGDITWIKQADSKNQRIDIRYSWSAFFDHKPLFNMYAKNERLLAVVAVVVKADKKMYQGDKESLAVTLFNGHEYIDSLRMWPDKTGKLNKAITSQINKCSIGLAIIRPSKFMDKPSGTLVSWIKLGGTT